MPQQAPMMQYVPQPVLQYASQFPQQVQYFQQPAMQPMQPMQGGQPMPQSMHQPMMQYYQQPAFQQVSQPYMPQMAQSGMQYFPQPSMQTVPQQGMQYIGQQPMMQGQVGLPVPQAGQIFQELKIFGSDLFERTLGMPVGEIAISETYRVGPGDTFMINVWGSEEASFTAQITTTGELLLPKYGSIPVTGLAFGEMKRAVAQLVGSRLSGFNLSVVPIKPRRNSVFVVGEVIRPGIHELDGTATTLTALFKAGGPTRQGTFRKIEVRRGPDLVGIFDIYDFISRGDRSGDVELIAGDVVFVPFSGPKVAVNGAVKRPAIYELKEKEMTLGDALKLAGGMTLIADLNQIQVSRLQPHSGQIVFSREISRADTRFEGDSTPLQDFDTVMVMAISPRKRENVSLEGHVFESGIRPWRPGIKLSEILSSPGMLKREPALEYGEILREGGAGGEYEVVSFNPGRVINREPEFDLELKPKDRIIIFPASLMRDRAKISVNGYVMNPGIYDFSNGMRVKDLIYRSGGLKQGASLVSAELSRRLIADGKLLFERIEVDLDQAMNDNPDSNMVLQPFDTLMVRSIPNWQMDCFITLNGEFKFPGRYSFQPGEKLSTVIKRAGGYSDKAYLKAAVFTRTGLKKAQADTRGRNYDNIKQEQQLAALNKQFIVGSYPAEKVARELAVEQYKELITVMERTQPEGRMVISLDDLEKSVDSRYDVALEDGDELMVPTRPSSVMIEGAVYNSMAILWEMNRNIRHYLNRVGGVAKTGDIANTYLIRADGTVVSRKTAGSSFVSSTMVEPGDILLVPTAVKIPVDHWQRNLDVVKVLSNLALTALAIDRYR
jgi:protein involved in polysaccharide export with SLBB domain